MHNLVTLLALFVWSLFVFFAGYDAGTKDARR
jgi:hypothetical protein